MTKYPDPNKKPKHLKKRTREQVLRNRKILNNISAILAFIGIGCIFLFSGTRIECELPWGLLIVGCIALLLSSLGIHILESTNGR